jgi:L-serine dehydratase
MAFISVCNDVLGPIMRGPSSSHTAGGYRIGVMVRGLLAEEPGSVRVTFDPEGSMAPTYRPLGVDLALTAGLMGWSMLDERYFEALDRAGDEGVTLDFQIAPLEHTDHPNGMLIETESVSGRRLRVVAEAVGGGGVRIVRIDDWPVDIDGKSSQVMVEIDAESGADVVSLLSDPNRQVAGGSVLLNARTDALEDDGAVAGIGKLSGVTNVWAVSPVFFVRKGETLFESAEEMVTMAEERGLSLGETALAYEVELLGMTELEAVDEMCGDTRSWRRPSRLASTTAGQTCCSSSPPHRRSSKRKAQVRLPSAASTPARRHGRWQ